MYGIPKQGLNPDYKPDDQSRVVAAPSDAGPLPASESFDGFEGSPFIDHNHDHQFYFVIAFSVVTDLDPALIALHDRITCEGCE